MNINMSRLKFINETVINDTNNIRLLESKIKTLKNKVDQLRSEDRRLKNLNIALEDYNNHIINAEYNTEQIKEIRKQLLKDNKTIKALETNIYKLREERKTLEKCDKCNKIDPNNCYKELNLIQISDDKFKCDKCSSILSHCDCYDCYNKTNTTGTFRKLLDKYNLLTNNINNDTIQLESNNNILNNNITELNELNMLLKWNDKSPELFNIDSNINIRNKITDLENLIIPIKNIVNDLIINIRNNKEELLSISKEFGTVCIHNRDYKNYTFIDDYDGLEYKNIWNCNINHCNILETKYERNYMGYIRYKVKCKYCPSIFNIRESPQSDDNSHY